MVVFMKTAAFWDVMPCCLIGVYRSFRGFCLHHHQDGSKILWPPPSSGWQQDPMKCQSFIPDYTTSHRRRQQSLYNYIFMTLYLLSQKRQLLQCRICYHVSKYTVL